MKRFEHAIDELSRVLQIRDTQIREYKAIRTDDAAERRLSQISSQRCSDEAADLRDAIQVLEQIQAGGAKAAGEGDEAE